MARRQHRIKMRKHRIACVLLRNACGNDPIGSAGANEQSEHTANVK